MPSFEVLLPVGAIALYLYDSTLLLYSNELMFVQRAGRWAGAQGSALLLAGRRLYFPNPLAPATPEFRVRWLESDARAEQENEAQLAGFLAALQPVRWLVSVLLVILIALPLELALFGTGLELLVLMVVFYGVIIVALVFVHARRRDLGLSDRAFVALAFDALACAPFAINLVRKLSLRRSLAGNPIQFAQRNFDPAGFSGLIRAVSHRVADEQQREYGQTPRWVELEAYRQQLNALDASNTNRPA